MTLTPSHSELVRFLSHHKLWVKRGDGRKPTHLSMDGMRGGMAHVPERLDTEFRQAYGATLEQQLPTFLVESRTDRFRFFVDVDLVLRQGTRNLCRVQRDMICQVVIRTVALFYPGVPKINDNRFLAVVCDTTADQLRVDAATKKTSEFQLKIQAAMDEDALGDIMIRDGDDGGEREKDKEEEENEEEDDDIVSAPHSLPSNRDIHPKGANMHIHFPNIIVDQQQAITMCMACAAKMTQILPSPPYIEGDWFSTFDPRVYEKNGLRMYGARKCKQCPKCSGKRHGACSTCGGGGKVDEGRAYHAARVIRLGTDDTGLLDRLQGNVFIALKYCTIREFVRPITDGWVAYDGCMLADGPRTEFFNGKRSRIHANDKVSTNERFSRVVALDERVDATGTVGRYHGDKSLRVEADGTLIPRGSRVFSACLQVTRSMHARYANVDISNIWVNKGRTVYSATLRGEGQHFCMNLTRDPPTHGSHTVYVVIKPKGAQQRCFCRCDDDDGRRSGLCKRFSSPPSPLLDDHVNLLFPAYARKHPLPVPRVSSASSATAATTDTAISNRLYHSAFVTPQTDTSTTSKRAKLSHNSPSPTPLPSAAAPVPVLPFSLF